jgi:hypothetical protein
MADMTTYGQMLSRDARIESYKKVAEEALRMLAETREKIAQIDPSGTKDLESPDWVVDRKRSLDTAEVGGVDGPSAIDVAEWASVDIVK